MRVGEARAVAAAWVAEHAGREDGFRGAFVSGSTLDLLDDAVLPETSDLDVSVVTAGEPPAAPLGKFSHRGVLLEVSHLRWEEVADPERVLATYYLAPSFRADSVLADPTGELGRVHAHVAARFAEPAWVRRRCAGARERIEARLTGAPAPGTPFHEQVLTWLFGTGVTTHVLLVAALRNPTVRLRYRAVREVLAEHGELAHHEQLLALLGCRDVPAATVRRHLDALAATFDATAAVARTPLFFRGDITPEARPVAINGSRELVETGLHREAVFWIVATFARCHTLLAADAPALHRARLPTYGAALADLVGIAAPADLPARAAEVRRALPEVWAAAERIITTREG